MFTRNVKTYKHTLVLVTMSFHANLQEYLRLLTETAKESPVNFDFEDEKSAWKAIKRGLVERVYELEPLPIPLIEISKTDQRETEINWADNIELSERIYDLRRARALVLKDLFTAMARPEFDRVQEYIQTGLLLNDILDQVTASSDMQGLIQQTRDQLSNELAVNLQSFMSGQPLRRIVETERVLAQLSVKLDDNSKIRVYRNAWLKTRQKVVGTENVSIQTTFKQDFENVLDLITQLRNDPTLANEEDTLLSLRLVEENLENALNEGETRLAFRTLVQPSEANPDFIRLQAEFDALLDRIERRVRTPTGLAIVTYTRKLKSLRRQFAFIYGSLEDVTVETIGQQQQAFQDELAAAVDALWIPGRALPNVVPFNDALRIIELDDMRLKNKINDLLVTRSQLVDLIRRHNAGLVNNKDQDMVAVASWRQTEQQLAAFVVHHPIIARAHKAVKRLAATEEEGQVLESVHTLPAEKKLYQAVEALKEVPELAEQRDQIKQIIGASPRRSQLVKVRYLIRKRDSDIPGSKPKPLFDTQIKDVIICPSTTYQEIRDQEPSEKLQEGLNKYGARFEGAYASFTEKRLVRKNKQFVARIKGLSQRVTDSMFAFTDSKNRKEERPFPVGRDYRNKVTLFFAWESN
jgi:hypothetical protein